MRSKKDIEVVEVLAKEAEFPKIDSKFEQLHKQLKLVVEMNLGCIDDLYYNEPDGLFYIEKAITYHPLKTDIWIEGRITSSIDVKRPLIPQFEEILETYSKLREESLENERNFKQ